jgi:hypothetical protein
MRTLGIMVYCYFLLFKAFSQKIALQSSVILDDGYYFQSSGYSYTLTFILMDD